MKIVNVKPKIAEPDLLIIEFLEDMLKAAKESKIYNIACVFLDEDGTNLSFYSAEHEDALKLYGAWELACDQYKTDILYPEEHDD